MTAIPWRNVKSWFCLSCGRCCIGFKVALMFNEWINIVRTFGIETTKPGIDRFYLNKKVDGTCIFLYNFFNKWLCGLQHMKPTACKLWPFKIYRNPKYGRSNEARFTYGKNRLFIYADPLCPGTRWGTPTWEFITKTLPEFVEIGLRIREKQDYSTSKTSYFPIYLKNKRKGLPLR